LLEFYFPLSVIIPRRREGEIEPPNQAYEAQRATLPSRVNIIILTHTQWYACAPEEIFHKNSSGGTFIVHTTCTSVYDRHTDKKRSGSSPENYKSRHLTLLGLSAIRP